MSFNIDKLSYRGVQEDVRMIFIYCKIALSSVSITIRENRRHWKKYAYNSQQCLL